MMATLGNRPQAQMMAFDDGDKGKSVSSSDPLPVTIAGSSGGTPTAADDVTVAAVSVTLAAANPSRKAITVQNTGSANMRLTWDGSAPTSTHGLQMAAGDVVTLTAELLAVKAIREGGTSTTAAVVEES